MSDKFMFAPEIRFIIFSMSIYLPYFTHRDAHYGVITEVSTLRSAKRLALGFEWHPWSYVQHDGGSLLEQLGFKVDISIANRDYKL